MDKDLLIHINQEKHRDLFKYASQVNRSFSERAIHEFRVSYKKMRAFLRMLSAGKGGLEKYRINKNLKKSYRIAGEIRDMHLHVKKMQAATLRPEHNARYEAGVKKEIKKIKGKLSESLNEKHISANQMEIKKKLPLKFTLNELENFARQKWESISAAIKMTDPDKDIHNMRKHLKDLYYVYELYKQGDTDVAKKILLKGNDQKFMKECMDVLGRLQDCISSVALLDDFSKAKKEWRIDIPRLVVKEKWLADIEQDKTLIVKKISDKLNRYEK